mgnify:CR=1 FL=1
MSLSIRRHRPGQESQGYLSSVADLMSALLFIFILVLVAAVYQIGGLWHKVQAKGEQLTLRLQTIQNKLDGANADRAHMLKSIQQSLKDAGIDAEIDAPTGVLRIPDREVTFATGSSELDEVNREKITNIGTVLEKMLYCRIATHLNEEVCRQQNPSQHLLDAIFVEGHTDNQPFAGDLTGEGNRLLSTRRANAVYAVMVLGNPTLQQFKNIRKEAIFSLSGYGADRPVKGHEHALPTNDPSNRRIEFRLIYTQQGLSDQEKKFVNQSWKEYWNE